MTQRSADRRSAGMMAAGAATRVALVGMLACTAGGCYTRLASLHPATDITDASADGDHVYLPDSYDDPRDSAYRDSRAYGNYPEDRYLDPYLSGITYSDHYGSGTSGYRDYYQSAWWLDPHYGGRYSGNGGGGYGSHGSGISPIDSTGQRVERGRRLWTTPDQPQPGVVQPSVSHDGGAPGFSGGGGSSTPPGGGAAADSTKAAPKKGTGRRLWR